MTVKKNDIVIAGLPVHVYSETPASRRPTVVFFLLHGRQGSAEEVDPIARSVIEQSHAQHDRKRDLIIVTFDQRNHGARLLSPMANEIWSDKQEKNNKNHAIDMYSIQTGTARDVSFLIDFLPSYIFADGNQIVDWGVAGISLGGHSTWIALSQDSRIRTGIPIIGCPDYIALIKQRAEKSSVPFSPPYIPGSLLETIGKFDPASQPYKATDVSNPFLGKKVLILSGQEDTLVPWSASKAFAEGLQVGPDGKKTISVQHGVGHECTTRMVEEMSNFIATEVL